jgi:3-hydroxyacyl-[acyl-carrier-protein] dehydratase
MEADRSMREKVLAMVPQQRPFRFIDDILTLDEEHIVGVYRFRSDEYFYKGHFPGLPITPGVILIETMAQTGVVAFGLYLSLLSDGKWKGIEELITLFTLAENVEFTGIVGPGETLTVKGRKVYFRGNQLRVEVSMERHTGDQVCSGILTGRGVPRAQFLGQHIVGSAEKGAL